MQHWLGRQHRVGRQRAAMEPGDRRRMQALLRQLEEGFAAPFTGTELERAAHLVADATAFHDSALDLGADTNGDVATELLRYPRHAG